MDQLIGRKYCVNSYLWSIESCTRDRTCLQRKCFALAQLECSRHLLTLLARHSRSESGLYAVLAASPSHGLRVMMRRIFTVEPSRGLALSDELTLAVCDRDPRPKTIGKQAQRLGPCLREARGRECQEERAYEKGGRASGGVGNRRTNRSRVDLQNQPATSTDCKILLHSGSLALCT